MRYSSGNKMLNIRMKRESALTMILFLVTMTSYMICVRYVGEDGRTIDNLRFAVMAFSIAVGFFELMIRRKINKNAYFLRECAGMVFVALFFYGMSVLRAWQSGCALSPRTYVELVFMLLPVFYTFCLVNLLSISEVITVFKIILVISFFFYIEEVGFLNFLDISNWLSISYSNSNSVFESSAFSGFAMNFFIFFLYFQNMQSGVEQKVSSDWAAKFSFIFVLLTFKRIPILFAVILFLLYHCTDIKKPLRKSTVLLTQAGIVAATVLYIAMLDGRIFRSFDMYQFTTGRTYIYSLWRTHGFFSYGYGSSTEIIGRYLEMDLVKIYLELGIFSLAVFVGGYFSVVGRNRFAYFTMLYVFANLLMASSLQNSFTWTILLLTVACVTSNKPRVEKIDVITPKNVLRRLLR